MTEKVLGFKKKDAEILLTGIGKSEWLQIILFEENLVPVNLKSESVTIEWLEKEIKQHLKILDECDVAMEDPRMRLNLLLSAVHKQAKAVKE